jgi:hypothetical protein
MSDPTDIAVRTQRFRDAVRAFTRPSPIRHAKLMPMKEGIIELRQKGASLRLIRELLATVDVAVSTDTIARFLADVNRDAAPARRSKRTRRHCASSATATEAPAPAQAVGPSPDIEPPPERSRIRGPRIADPHNL